MDDDPLAKDDLLMNTLAWMKVLVAENLALVHTMDMVVSMHSLDKDMVHRLVASVAGST